MSDQLIVKLVPRDEVEREAERLKKKHNRLLITWIVVAALFGGLGAAISREFFPVKPESISVSEAAQLLQMQKGYAGYSLIKDEPGYGSTIGHAIFCQNCGNEIATMYMNFLEPKPPKMGTRSDLMTRLEKYVSNPSAIAAVKKKADPSGPKPVEVN